MNADPYASEDTQRASDADQLAADDDYAEELVGSSDDDAAVASDSADPEPAVDIDNETDYPVDTGDIFALVRHAYAWLHQHPESELSVTFVNEDTIEDLHVRWLDLPGPTDVMSFPMDELTPGTAEDPAPQGTLGDIVVCPTVCAAQAQAAGHSAEHEMRILLTHGLLHLLGYDHVEPDEEREMFDLQQRIVRAYEDGERRG